MTAWLDPVRRALDVRATPLAIFFRDDDGGWADDRLFALLDTVALHGFPIDLALIPTAVGEPLAGDLLARIHGGSSIGVHQHGFMHLNHEVEGRPCEFGPSRAARAQLGDIDAGRRALLDLFDAFLDPIFTPPWNRCTSTTGHCLMQSGIAAISRDRSAAPLDIDGLTDCSVRVDWFARVKGKRLEWDEWAGHMAQEVQEATGPLGVMLHHAVMDDNELRAFGDLLKTLATSASVRGLPMRAVVAARSAGSFER
jgi:hypothetical protein